MKKNKSISVYFILELVFGIIGTVFTLVSLIMKYVDDKTRVRPHASSDIRIISGTFFGIGMLFLLAALVFYLIILRKERIKEMLRTGGRSIMAKVDSIDINRNIEVNGVHPFVIRCSYEDSISGNVYKFKSENVMFDVSYYEGREIRVFVDNNDYKCYYVEVDEA